MVEPRVTTDVEAEEVFDRVIECAGGMAAAEERMRQIEAFVSAECRTGRMRLPIGRRTGHAHCYLGPL
jgi:hypothetical protein